MLGPFHDGWDCAHPFAPKGSYKLQNMLPASSWELRESRFCPSETTDYETKA